MFSCSHSCLLYYIVTVNKCSLKETSVLILLLKFTARSKSNYIKFISGPRPPHLGSTTSGNPLQEILGMPQRNDQCRSHRSGTACGSCKYGYTLSIDSTECLNIESCTAGQTVLVILLTVTYWIVIVILVFAIMYYKVGIGYLYCITYYYSIGDILLSQNLQASKGLYLTVNIISSFSKIAPQFIGELCLTTGMSGIDQQFIHYIHPSAVILNIVIISLLARKSPKFTAIISRGIIHVICLLLLLSYTSIASTSLLLMRSQTFHKIDKVYTYLSPDIEYFHGRHLAYGIVMLSFHSTWPSTFVNSSTYP